ncbi:MAG TPA: response regulator [Vicinamibacterales bacterium]|jgi:CheY-like chemotaxis protein|nr:response regulator [Vicinamibacterales bacterium]
MSARPSKVLIIDDDESTRMTFAQMLRLEGHEVRTASNASSGLDEATLLGPDAIIVDLHMPAMDGLTFVQRLRERERGAMTPVAIVTGDYTFKQGVSTALEDLGVTICFKPLWLEDLVKLAGELIEHGPHHGPEPPTRAH